MPIIITVHGLPKRCDDLGELKKQLKAAIIEIPDLEDHKVLVFFPMDLLEARCPEESGEELGAVIHGLSEKLKTIKDKARENVKLVLDNFAKKLSSTELSHCQAIGVCVA